MNTIEELMAEVSNNIEEHNLSIFDVPSVPEYRVCYHRIGIGNYKFYYMFNNKLHEHKLNSDAEIAVLVADLLVSIQLKIITYTGKKLNIKNK